MKVLAVAAGLGLMLGTSAPAHERVVVIAIRIHYSHYIPSHVTVPAGVPIRFVITNEDPIAHEFVLGTRGQQLKHESGPAHSHDGVPGQATIGIGERDEVVWTFEHDPPLLFACHRVGHYAYGMVGAITVR